jgi:hypothetical protein
MAIHKLWMIALGGPLLVLANLEALYLLVPWSCRHQSWPLHAAVVASAMLVVAAIGTAWRERSAPREVSNPGGEAGRPSAGFLALTGLLTATLSLAVLVAQWIPVLILHPCMGGG